MSIAVNYEILIALRFFSSIPDPDLNVGSAEVIAVASTVHNRIISNMIETTLFRNLPDNSSSTPNLSSIGAELLIPILKAYWAITRYESDKCNVNHNVNIKLL